MTTKAPRTQSVGLPAIPDLTLLEAAARRMEGGEHYHQIARGKAFRLGVVASASDAGDVSLRIELLLRIYRADGEATPSAFVKAARLLNIVAGMNYASRHQDGGWIMCEKPATRDDLTRECESLLRAIRENLANRPSEDECSSQENF